MIGWYFDIVVGFLIRAVVRFVKIRSSETWPVEMSRRARFQAQPAHQQCTGDQSANWGTPTFTKGNTTLAYTGKRSCRGVPQKTTFLKLLLGRKSQYASNQLSLKRPLLLLMNEIALRQLAGSFTGLRERVWGSGLAVKACCAITHAGPPTSNTR
jgi:hypothetical protein